MLASLVPQVKALADKVELVVCDDRSPDDTAAVIEAARKIHPFTFERNATNQGAIRNFHKVTAVMPRGDYVWLLGQDDVPTEGAVARLVAALEANPDLDLFYLNYRNRGPDGPGDVLLDWPNDRRVARWQELIERSGWLGSGMFVHVFRRRLWMNYWRANPPGEDAAVSDGKTHPQVNPHCYLVADYGLDRPAYFLAAPSLWVTLGPATWENVRYIVFVKHYPDILFYFRRKGLTRAGYRYNARWVFERASWVMKEKLNEPDAPVLGTLLPFVRDYAAEPLAWRAALRAYLHSRRLAPVKRLVRAFRAKG